MKKSLLSVTIMLSILAFMLTSCSAGSGPSNNDAAVDGMAFDYFGTYDAGYTYSVYKPNDYNEALAYEVISFDVKSRSQSWIVNYEDVSYYYSNKEIVEPDEAINMLYDELEKNKDNINLLFDFSIEKNNSTFTIERELLNPNKDEISYIVFFAYIPFLIKNIDEGYEHFVYVPVYRSIILLNGNNVEDPFDKTMITMEAFEAKYNQ